MVAWGLTDGDVALAWLEGTVGVTAMDRWHWRARLVVLGDWVFGGFSALTGLVAGTVWSQWVGIRVGILRLPIIWRQRAGSGLDPACGLVKVVARLA